MTAAARRLSADWLHSAPLTQLFAAFPPGALRCVGGCVRDALAGLAVKDIDLASALPPDEMIACLKQAGITMVPTGLKHGTVTAVIDRRPYEITSLRHDVETDGRHARVAFTDDWQADAARRDLTINAIYCDPDGTLYDPFGGAADLAAGRVRFVGEASARIQEDYLRLLRYFRFQARFGKGAPDPAAIAACRALAPGLARLSAERVHDELIKLLGGPQVSEVVTLMARNDVLRHANPALTRADRLSRLVGVEERLSGQVAGVRPDPIRRLAALLSDDDPEAVRQLRLSNRELARIEAIHAALPEMASGLDVHARRRLIFDLGAEVYRDRCLLALAEDSDADAAGWLEQLAEADSWSPPVFPLSGRDVLRLGVPAGPDVGRLLGQVRHWWRDGGFAADRAACLAKLGDAAASLRG